MYSVMKKIIILTVIGLLAAVSLSAEDQKEVFLRFSQVENTIRIVLESDESTIKNAIVTASVSGVKIEFDELFVLNKQQDFPLEHSVTDRSLSIIPKDAEDVVSYKLGGPSRIVMDIKLAQKSPVDPPGSLKVQIIELPKKEPKKSVFLDAGHGGFDYGLISPETKEKDLNLILAKKLDTALLKQGRKTFLTRKADQSVSILDRVLLANSKKPDIFISLHSSVFDAFVIYTGLQAEEIINSDISVNLYSLAVRQTRHIEKSRALAAAMGRAFRRGFKKEVILRELPLPVLVSMDSPAILIEYPSLLLNSYDQKTSAMLINAVMEGLGADE
jgi:N-acetylmuramoyl-L-alanine amidase